MKKILLFLVLSLAFEAANAQCSYDNTITSNPVLSGGNEVVCSSQSITFTAPSGYDSYQWKYKFSASGSPYGFTGETGNTLTILAGDIGFAYVYATITHAGCTSDTNEIMFDTWVFGSPAISHDSDTNLCYGESAIISNAFNGPANFRWYQNGSVVQEGTQDYYEVTETGSYMMEVSYEQCPDQWLSSGVPVDFTVVGEDTVIYEDQGVLYTSSNGVSYEWYVDGNLISGANSSSHTPTQNGMYTVVVAYQGGGTCSITSSEYNFQSLSIGENDFDFGVYFENTLVINSHFLVRNPQNQSVSLTVFDITGKKIMNTNFTDSQYSLAAGNWSKGLYFCILETPTGSKKIKLLK